MPANKILYGDNLRTGTDKINAIIEGAEQAIFDSSKASNLALSTSRQLSRMIIENGTSDAEVLQARVKSDGTEFPVLADRFTAIEAEASAITENLANVTELVNEINGLSTANRYIYVDVATGNDTTGDGTVSKKYKTIQKAFDSIPKVINRDIYIEVTPGTYPEEALIKGVIGAAITIRANGTVGDVAVATGLAVKSLTFYDMSGYTVVNDFDMYESNTITQRATILFSRCVYGTVNSCRFDSATRDNGTGIPSIEWDGSGGSANSNYFTNQHMCINSKNGSRVRVDSTNQMGVACGTALHAQAAFIFKNGANSWTLGATLPEDKEQGGQIW